MDAYGVITRLHPGGPAAHRHRQQALLQAGWRLVDAFPSRWTHDPVRAALAVAAASGSAAGPRPEFRDASGDELRAANQVDRA